MKSIVKIQYLIFVLLLLASCGSDGSSDSNIKYKLIDLGTFDGDVLSASGINNNGVIVGGPPEDLGYIYSPVYPSSFMWKDNQYTTLWTGGNAYDINGKGSVVGCSGGAVLWQNGTIENLGGGCAYHINDSDQIVGVSSENAVIWENATMASLGTPNGDTSIAYAINNNGQIVGCSGTSGQLDTTGVLWDNGSVSILPTHDNSWYSCAIDINDAGQIVGASLSLEYGEKGFLYENGSFRDLGNIQAKAINNTGQIVGGDKLFDLNENQMYDLNEIIDTKTFIVKQALDINDKGEIVGYGSFDGSIHAFYLIPQ